jgi:hypothetical protein
MGIRGDGHPQKGMMWGTRAPPEFLPAGDRVATFWGRPWDLGTNHHVLRRKSDLAQSRTELLSSRIALYRPEEKHAAGVTTDRFGQAYFKTELGRFDHQDLRSHAAADGIRNSLSEPQLHRHSFDSSAFLRSDPKESKMLRTRRDVVEMKLL